jgi:hypothetical protein
MHFTEADDGLALSWHGRVFVNPPNAGKSACGCRRPASRCARAAQRSPKYLRIDPKGRVPALVTDRGILTESPAMLAFIAQTFPQADEAGRWLASVRHPAPLRHDLYGALPVKRLFLGSAASSLFGAGKAVLHPVACDQVRGARGRGQGTETLAKLGGFAA